MRQAEYPEFSDLVCWETDAIVGKGTFYTC